MATPFPMFSRGELVVSRQEALTAQFIETEVAAGTPYSDPVTDDAPVIYQLDYILPAGEARAFEQWYRNPKRQINRGAEFTITIGDAFGEAVQTARLTSSGLPTKQQIGANLWLFKFGIIIRDYQNPDDEFSDFIIDNPDFLPAFDYLERLVNVAWPEV